MAKALALIAAEKKARHPRLLRVAELTSYTDFVLLLTATSDRHARALADHLLETMRERKIRALGVEGHQTGQWVLLDFGDVVVHVLQDSARDYYDLDHLWREAEELPVGESA